MSSISSSDEFHSSSESSSLSSSSGVCPEDDPGLQSCNTTEKKNFVSTLWFPRSDWKASALWRLPCLLFGLKFRSKPFWEKWIEIQECILVGCVPSAVVAAGRGGGGGDWGVSQHALGGGGCPLWTEWQMLVKILPYHNYVADGNKCTNGYFYNNHEM